MMTKTRIGNYLRRHTLGDQPTFRQGFKEGVAFAQRHTSPPASKPWVGLTEEEKADLFEGTAPYYNEVDYADAIEAKLREKNA